MFRQRYLLFFISILFLATLACNAFAGDAEPGVSLPPPEVTVGVSTAVADETAAPGLAPTATLPGDTTADETAVASGDPIANILVDLNIRTGPGVNYDRIGFFLEGSTAIILGQDPATGWWKVQCPPDVPGPECWISGGAEYTAAVNAAGVPVAQVPPTPTPIPTETPTTEPSAEPAVVVGQSSTIAYADDDGVWAVPLDLSQSPPQAGDPTQLLSGSDIEAVFISPDGQKVAYLTGSFEANALGVVNIDGSGNTTLVESAVLPLADDSGDFATLIADVAWLPNSQSLAFNTSIVNLVGPGVGPQADLWTVSLSGTLQERFAAGTGGHTFALSPDGSQVIFGSPTAVLRTNLDGTGTETVITFPAINTASEYAYAPTAQWTPDGSQAYLAIPGPDPWQADASAALYRVPDSGPAVQIGSVPGNILFSPVQWTKSGSNLGYAQFIPDGGSMQSIVLADGNGENPQPYRSGEQMAFYGWSGNGQRFLYAGDGFFGVGQQGSSPVEVIISVQTADMQWLNNNAYIVAIGSDGAWNLSSANSSGATELLAVAETDVVQFDVWTP